MSVTWSAVVLSQGDRPKELGAAVDSLLAQQGVSLEVIVVGNGWDPIGLPDAVRTVYLTKNVGIPKGRNKGVKVASGSYFYFLDDDAMLPEDDTVARIERMFEDDSTLGVVQTRIASPEGVSAKRWVPRMRDKDPMRSSEVFSVLEGSVAVREQALESARGWASRFFYAHEGIELAWRVWDANYTVEYRADLIAHHPLIDPARHDDQLWLNARNRVWLAKRNLPCPVAVAYIFNWSAVSLARTARHPSSALAWVKGACAGLRTDGGARRPIGWDTVWQMTKRGRPPII
ncbi:glycosyltransferase family 2 protein [Demequina aurantiaca]|uniref:glycosyltransferase family 2 protein n=1 Tax=Demequina aurantiaca TaxID=676200 RepID=UPI0007839026|nr:glycosyltransferase [Demequina aurantiaca]